eukprot:3580381-Pleurochrysis_carterae.AAC.2
MFLCDCAMSEPDIAQPYRRLDPPTIPLSAHLFSSGISPASLDSMWPPGSFLTGSCIECDTPRHGDSVGITSLVKTLTGPVEGHVALMVKGGVVGADPPVISGAYPFLPKRGGLHTLRWCWEEQKGQIRSRPYSFCQWCLAGLKLVIDA